LPERAKKFGKTTHGNVLQVVVPQVNLTC